MVVPTSRSRAPLFRRMSGIRNDPPISTSSPRETTTSIPSATVLSARISADAALLTTKRILRSRQLGQEPCDRDRFAGRACLPRGRTRAHCSPMPPPRRRRARWRRAARVRGWCEARPPWRSGPGGGNVAPSASPAPRSPRPSSSGTPPRPFRALATASRAAATTTLRGVDSRRHADRRLLQQPFHGWEISAGVGAHRAGGFGCSESGAAARRCESGGVSASRRLGGRRVDLRHRDFERARGCSPPHRLAFRSESISTT